MTTMYRLTISPGCLNCGCCSYILPGWPDQFKSDGLLISQAHAERNAEAIDKIVSRCPLDLIELNEVPPCASAAKTG